MKPALRRTLLIVLGVVASLGLIVLGAGYVLTNTEFGRERARRLTLNVLRDMVKSEVSIGRIEGNLLGRFSLIDVTIADEPGRPFLTAKRLTARLATRSLISQRVLLTELTLEEPVIRLSKRPGGEWNFARIFSTGPDTVSEDSTTGLGDWIEMHDITLHNGTIIVQQPWAPDEALTVGARDSATRAAIASQSRARVDSASWGLRETMDFRAIDARIPRFIVAHPDSAAMTLKIDRLSMIAAPFRPPEIAVRDFRGDVRIGDDTITVGDLALRLPGSYATGAATYTIEDGDLLLALKVDSLALADVRALYPPLPETGGGSLELKAAIRTSMPSEYTVTDAHLRIGDTRVDGNLGLVLSDDSTRFRATDLRFVDFPTSLVEQLAPRVDVPTPGTFSGRAELDGPVEGMQVAIDAVFDPAREAPFRIVARGGAGMRDSAFVADRLALRVDALPVAFLRNFASDVPVRGTLSADATVSGSSAGRLTTRFAVTHRGDGPVSRVTGSGTIAPSDALRMDMALRFAPVSLALARRYAPDVELQGDITGTARLRGTPRDMAARLDLILPSGTAIVDGSYDMTARQPVYQGTLEVRNVDVHALAPKMPTTMLSGVTTFSGTGFDPATMNARLSSHFVDIVVDSTNVQEATIHVAASGGQLTVDTLRIRTHFGIASVDGTFGLAEGREAKLAYRVDVQSLAGLERWITTGDTGVMEPRPGVRQRIAVLAARADSIRQAELENSQDLAVAIAAEEARGRRPVRQRPPGVPPIARDSTAGAFRVAGEVTGHIKRFTASGTATTDGLVWDGNAIGKSNVEFVYADIRTPNAIVTATARMDSVRAAGFAFDSTHVRGDYVKGEGELEMTIFPQDTSAYRVNAEYALRTGEGEVRLRDISLRIDTTTWASTRPSTISWRGRGFQIDSLELRSRTGGGRIFANGEIPDVDPGTLDIAVDSLRIAPWLRLFQSDVEADGLTSFRGRIEGTRLTPRITGSLEVLAATYDGVPFPDLHTTLGYADRKLTIDGDLQRADGAQLARVEGVLPIDLSLGDSVKTRLIDAPITLDIAGDSIPLAPLGGLSDAFSDVQGRAFGAVGIRGTYERPRMEGEMSIDLRRVGIPALGITVRGATMRLRMSGDTLVIDSLVARSGGSIGGSGTVVLANLTHPVLDVTLHSDEARLLDNEWGELFVDSRVRITGPLDTLSITGTTNVTHGVINIPEPEERDPISTGDPAILAVIDSTTAVELGVAPEEPSEILKNMSVDVDLIVSRGTWARSQDANVEIFGELGIELEPVTQQLSLDGALRTEQGEYNFLGRRFDVTRGSVRFTGGSFTDPVLQVLATYEVRQAGRAPLDIQIIIGGTLQEPRLSLESDAQPALSQSDLLSFLAFGRSSSSLLQFQGSGLSGGGQSGSSLVGSVAALATRQLAGFALGALADQVESDITRAIRADRFNITPASLPADLSLGGLGVLLRGTEVEVGKYVDRRTFVVAEIRPTNALPGAYVERRFGSDFRLRASFETRFQPQRPSLTTGLKPETLQVLGGLLTWSLKW